MRISDVNVSVSAPSSNKNKLNDSLANFSEIFSKKNTPDTEIKTESKNDFHPVYQTSVLPSGQAYTTFNVSDNLTESDKTYLKALGWPTDEYSEVNNLASWIAEDRVDGTLTGPVNKEYLFGSKEKGTVGLVGRLQGEGQEFKNLCERFLGIMENNIQDAKNKTKELSSTLLSTIDKNIKNI